MLSKSANDLSGFSVVETNLITGLPTYEHWKQRVETVADTIKAAHPEFEIRPYQVNHAAMFCMRRRNIMAHTQGAGKTFVSGLVIASLYPKLNRPGQVQIVACSWLSAQKRWLKDLERIPALAGRIALVKGKKLPDAPIWLYTCDSLRRRVLSRAKTERCSLGRHLGESHKPCLLIVDEVHLFQERTQRTRALDYLAKKSRRVLSLSGTLSDGRLDLIHNAARLTYQGHWPFRHQTEFSKRFGVKKQVDSTYIEHETVRERYLQQLSLDRLPDYYNLARRFIHRLTLNDPDVFPYIKRPEGRSNVNLVSPHPDHVAAYSKLVAEYLTSIETLASLDNGGMASRFGFIWQLFYASNSPWVNCGIHRPAKADKLLELISTHTKTAVFTSSIEVGRWLHGFLRSELGEDKVVRLYAQDDQADPASMSEEQRGNVLDAYCYTQDIKAGVFSLNLASMSIDMLSTDQVVFWDLPATGKPLPIQQAITRAVRPGNQNPYVDVNYLVHEGMLDYHTFRLLGQKLVNARLLMDYDLESLVGIDTGTVDAADLARAILGII